MGMYCVNYSDKSYTVYSGTNMTNVIGTIKKYDVFALLSTWSGSHAYYPDRIDEVYFRNPSTGITQIGFIMYDNDEDMEVPYLDLSFGNTNFGGTNYKTFKTRKALSFYDANANWKGTCVSGARIATNDTEPGQSYRYLMRAMFYETGVGTNIWKPISGVDFQYGFIDTGIQSGGTTNTIGVYGFF